mmetsp:Transcript_10551/g.15428  ORF Transcript_10551/g.15428 Transcript_10551/m.15428 type:complete len:621 (-) Transcript_10551:32-1894(-)
MGIIQSRRRTRERHRSFLPFIRKRNRTAPSFVHVREEEEKKESALPGRAVYNENEVLNRKQSNISTVDEASTTTSTNNSFLKHKSGKSLNRNDSTKSSYSRKDSAVSSFSRKDSVLSTSSMISSPGSPRKKPTDITRSIEVSPSKKTSFRKVNIERKQAKKLKLPPLKSSTPSKKKKPSQKSPLVKESRRRLRSRTFNIGQPAFLKQMFTKSSTSTDSSHKKEKDILTMMSVSIVNKVKLDLDEDGSKMINEYTMIRTIGEGSFAKVKLCMDDKNRAFAIKIMDKKYLQKSNSPAGHSMYESVLQEIDIMKRTRHPNIIRLYEVIDDPDHSKLYLIIEAAQQGTVLDLEKAKTDDNDPVQPLSPLKARSYFLDLIRAMIYLHNNNIAHRDIKPENLLLDDENRLKVSDFGVSKQLEKENEKCCYSLGTPAFMPPESQEGASFDLKKADIWSLGITLYVFLFGKLPFYAPTLSLLKQAIREDALVVPDVATENTKKLLVALLAKDPAKRPSLAEILYHPWISEDDHSDVPYSFVDEPKKEERPKPLEPSTTLSIATIANIKLGAKDRVRRARSRTIVNHTSVRNRIHTPSPVQFHSPTHASTTKDSLFQAPFGSFVKVDDK